MIENNYLRYSRTYQFGGEDIYDINGELCVITLTSKGENYEKILDDDVRVVNNYVGDRHTHVNASNSNGIHIQNSTKKYSGDPNKVKFQRNYTNKTDKPEPLKDSHWTKFAWLYGAIATGIITLILSQIV